MDEAVVRRAQRGDHDAFGVLVNSSINRLHAVAGLICRDPDVAQEAVQEALVRAWRDLPKLREPKSVSSWLAQLTVRATYDVLRRQRRTRELKPIAEDSAVSGDEAARSVDRLLLGWAYGRLPVDQRAVVVLHYHLGLSLDEVAATLGVPAGTVRSRLNSALTSMRRWIGPVQRPTAVAATSEVAR